MQISVSWYEAKKRVPLTISYGTHATANNLIVRVEEAGVIGLGEATNYSVADYEEDDQRLAADGERLPSLCNTLSAAAPQRACNVLREAGVGNACIAAVDAALWDWRAKLLGTDISMLLGTHGLTGCPTSVTIGISSPDAARTRVQQWRELGRIRAFKVKLGSPAGCEADREMFCAVREEIGNSASISVDANGGWTLRDAVEMSQWLATRGVDHIEQPLGPTAKSESLALRAQSPVKIFLDESVRTPTDVAAWAEHAHGINIKLMKCGGPTNALRMIHVARAHGLAIMLGCYGDGMLSNATALHLAPLVDRIDLDSHLNQIDTPFRGLSFSDGYLRLDGGLGIGVTYD
jgi:L-Ala-D/L-Glu epimerase